MSPRIEEVRTTETVGSPFIYFSMDLNDPTEFNADEFDNFALQISNKYKGAGSAMKFIVINDKMYLFNADLFHEPVLQSLNDAGIAGQVQCAGRVDIVFNKPYSGEDNYRALDDWSMSLKDKKILKREDSDKYKIEKIGSLGLPFVIS